MKNIETVLQLLKNRRDSFQGDFFIPVTWNYIEFDKIIPNNDRINELQINPYDFLIYAIEEHLLPHAQESDEGIPLGERIGDNFDLREGVVYGMIPRMFTAWNHSHTDQIQPGTWLKAIPLLPFLKSLAVDVVYVLPIFTYSDIYKKGEIGSPYAVKNMYTLDKNLHDPLLGEYLPETLEVEFKAFVEACHIMGIRVMIDFVFRTVARDNDWIVEHPEWFYWIDLTYNEGFHVPAVEQEPVLTVLTDETLDSLYTCSGLPDYLKQFTYPPSQLDPLKWKKVVETHLQTGQNILHLIEKAYGITTVPGFSDVLNDIQPLWTDVTYLKYYFDVHPKVQKYIKPEQPPYILQDAVCLNLYHSEVVNQELWEYIVGVIPYFQTEFGIDGARVDSGHALPPQLNTRIIQEVKSINPKFILWAEEFAAENTPEAKEYGFDFITGNLWHLYKELKNPLFQDTLLQHLREAQIPVTAALETPDTPRCANVFTNPKELELVVMLNFFLPNAVQYINSGMEMMEAQPMNLGLDNTEAGRYVLPADDPMYGKLAFFDLYQIHWLAEDREFMLALLRKGLSWHKRYRPIMSDPEHFLWDSDGERIDKLLTLGYFDPEQATGLFFVANLNLFVEQVVNLGNILPTSLKVAEECTFVYHKSELTELKWKYASDLVLEPGETVIGFVKSKLKMR